jgi:hypothetical protein
VRQLLLLPGLLLATPAMAQFWGGPGGDASAPVRATLTGADAGGTAALRRDVRRARNNAQLGRRDSHRLDREARQIDTLSQRYAADGVISAAEMAELQARQQLLRDDLTALRSGTAQP